MNKYTKLSDLEINKKVAVALGLISEVTHYGVVAKSNNKDYWFEFYPCNNPQDAMPIIKDNLISIAHDGIAWDVSCAKYPELSVWNGLENYNDNFYRKAMELFLLIKDAESNR